MGTTIRLTTEAKNDLHVIRTALDSARMDADPLHFTPASLGDAAAEAARFYIEQSVKRVREAARAAK